MSDEALRLRLVGAKTIPFTAQELTAICSEFGVRADYLFFGKEPMLDADLMDDLVMAIAEVGGQPREHASENNDLAHLVSDNFAESLHYHLTKVLAIVTEQEPSWVASHLPAANDLLQAVEGGIADALDEALETRMKDRALVNQSVRQAVATHVQQNTPTPDVPDTVFKSAVTGLANGTLIHLKKS